MIVQKAKIRSVPCQRRSLPSTCAVKTPSSATWRVIPLRLSAGRWAVQKAGYISGKIAMRQASPPGFRSVLGVLGALQPKRPKRSKGQSSTYVTAYHEVSRAASVLKSFGSICVDTTASHSPRVVRSIVSSSGIQGGDFIRRAMQHLTLLLALKTLEKRWAGVKARTERQSGETRGSPLQEGARAIEAQYHSIQKGGKKHTQGGLTTAAT